MEIFGPEAGAGFFGVRFRPQANILRSAGEGEMPIHHQALEHEHIGRTSGVLLLDLGI